MNKEALKNQISTMCAVVQYAFLHLLPEHKYLAGTAAVEANYSKVKRVKVGFKFKVQFIKHLIMSSLSSVGSETL